MHGCCFSQGKNSRNNKELASGLKKKLFPPMNAPRKNREPSQSFDRL